MESINVSTNWSTSKPIDSCIFVRLTGDDKKQNPNDSESDEDIESLLQSFEICVKCLEPIGDLDESNSCKLFIKTKDESEDGFKTKIHSFSLLSSAKVIEIHGNESNEYLKTLFNELVEELEGLSMYRTDHLFTEPQKEITITFKNFKELWIFGLIVKLIRVKQKPVIGSKGITSVASIFNMISMFSNSSQSSSSNDLIKKLSKLKTSDENESTNESQNISPNIRTTSLKSEPIGDTNSETNNDITNKTKGENRTQLSEQQICECLCHRSGIDVQNTDFLCQYIDQKVSDLEKSIETKFNALENKMFSVLNLFINKQ